MRKWARKVARKRMELKGIHRPCSDRNREGKKQGFSYFSLHWREYVKKRNGQRAA